MTNLITHAAPAAVMPRFMPIEGDSMQPLAKTGDLAAVVPVDHWHGPGHYVLEVLPGCLEIFRCESDFRGGLVLSRENPLYSTRTVTKEWFLAHVTAKVAGVMNLFDRSLMERAIAAAE